MFRIFSKVSPADIITMANAVCGVIASTYFIRGWGGKVEEITIGCCLLLLCMIFDGLDGIVARKFGSKHSYGTQLDSIADMLSFCWAPGILIFCAYYSADLDNSTSFLIYAATAFAIVFGMWRLVVFIKEGHKYKNFFGIPTPANCLFIISTCYFYVNYKAGNLDGIPIVATAAHLFSDTPQGLVLTMVVSLFMVSSFVYIKITGKFAKALGVVILIIFISFILNFQHIQLYFIPQFAMWVLIWGYVLFCPIKDLLDPSENGWVRRTKENQRRWREQRQRKREARKRRREEKRGKKGNAGWFLKRRHPDADDDASVRQRRYGDSAKLDEDDVESDDEDENQDDEDEDSEDDDDNDDSSDNCDNGNGDDRAHDLGGAANRSQGRSVAKRPHKVIKNKDDEHRRVM